VRDNPGPLVGAPLDGPSGDWLHLKIGPIAHIFMLADEAPVCVNGLGGRCCRLETFFSPYSQLLKSGRFFSAQLNHTCSWALPTIGCPKTRSPAAAFWHVCRPLPFLKKTVTVRTTTHQHIYQTPAPRSFGLTRHHRPTGPSFPDFMWNPPKF
jgi:hypothetical protein